MLSGKSILSIPQVELREMSLSTQSQRADELITAHLVHLFKKSNYWVSFLHVPKFVSRYFHRDAENVLQPCLVLALLALSVLMQSSEMEMGEKGRIKAMELKDRAQAAFDASIYAQWYDAGLTQGAWVSFAL